MMQCLFPPSKISGKILGPLIHHAGTVLLKCIAVATLLTLAIQPANAIDGGVDDADTPEANAVVNLGGFPPGCTGTLLTPRLVLTAAHCVALLGSVPGVHVGAHAASAILPVNSRTARLVNSRVNGSFDFSKEIGIDMAIYMLDSPVVDQAKIVRPSLSSPTIGGRDENGGDYPHIGMSGWSPFGPNDQPDPDRQLNRQSIHWNTVTLHHFPGLPDSPSGQYWVHVRDGTGSESGDSGGPLFVVRSDGTRDPIGVLSGTSWNLTSCGFYACNYWADITRGFNAQWIRDNVMDTNFGGGHTNRWLFSHRKTGEFWFGEVDYTGPCQVGRDRDCDHWFNEDDNCPDTANLDQADFLDNGIGDACRVPPPTPTSDDVPKNCLFSAQGCGNFVNVLCSVRNELPIDVRIEADSGSTSWTDAKPQTPQTFTFVDNSSVSHGSYKLCLRANHGICDDATYSVDFLPADHEACSLPGGGGDVGGIGGGGGDSGGHHGWGCHPHCPY